MKRKLIIILILLKINVFCVEEKDLYGVWQLVDITAFSTFDSPPKGFEAHKEYYQKSGKLTIIKANERLNEKSITINYELKNNTRIISTDEKVIREGKIVINDTILTIKYSDREIWTYKKIVEKSSFNKILEPLSVAVLQTREKDTQLSGLDVVYDTSDYSNQPIKERIVGVWEVISVNNYPELPPYGIPTTKLIITPDKKLFRIAASEDDLQGKKSITYEVSGDSLKLEHENELFIQTFSFNKWGHLKLVDNGVTFTLKLLRKNSSSILKIPTKVILFKNN